MKYFIADALKDHFAAPAPTRRTFLKMSASATGAAFLLGLNLPSTARADDHGAAKNMFTPFVKVMEDGTVVVLNKHQDMGQGNSTGLATLVAEEMDVSMDQVTTEFAPSAPEYNNLFFGAQGTGGSTAIANSFEQYRQAGATARAMFVAAAAQSWGVPAGEITVERGVISHSSGKSGGFGDFVDAASRQPVPEAPTLKNPADWIYIGKHVPRLDRIKKSTGGIGLYTQDMQPENYLVAVVAHPPRWGATVESFDATETKKVKGVVDVIQVPQGIAVLATSTWPAIKGRDQLSVTWDFSKSENRSSEQLFEDYRAIAETTGPVAETRGDAYAAIAGASREMEFTYEFPYLAHATMEPMNAVVQFDGTRATVWTGAQFQTVDHNITAAIFGVPLENVDIVTLWAGGSFGRRAVPNSDYIAEAATIAKAWGKPQPIKLVWTREDDMTGGYYRPMYVHKVKLGLDDQGNIAGWLHRIVGQSIVTGTALESAIVHNGIDHTSVEGVTDNSYNIENFQAELHTTKTGVPVLWWRSVGHTHTAYVMETMVDIVAKETGKDPLALRRELIKDDPRKLNVLNLVAEKANWGSPVEGGRYRGIAVHKSFNTYVAEVAEISMTDGTVKVEKVWCVVDCGIAVNPDNVVAQMEGGIGYGLSAILRNEITLTDGEVDQTNFDSYNPLRIEDMPEVEVHVVASDEAPTGAGEPGTPPVGPAVANAIFAATGTMPTILPFSRTGLSS